MTAVDCFNFGRTAYLERDYVQAGDLVFAFYLAVIIVFAFYLAAALI